MGRDCVVVHSRILEPMKEFEVTDVVGHNFGPSTLVDRMVDDFWNIYSMKKYEVRTFCERYDDTTLSDFDRKRLYRFEHFINEKYKFDEEKIVCYEDDMTIRFIIPGVLGVHYFDLRRVMLS